MLPSLNQLSYRIAPSVSIPIPNAEYPSISVKDDTCVICLEPLRTEDVDGEEMEEVEALKCGCSYTSEEGVRT